MLFTCTVLLHTFHPDTCWCANLVEHNPVTWYLSFCVFLLVCTSDSSRNFTFRPQFFAPALQRSPMLARSWLASQLENIKPKCWRCICCPLLLVKSRQNSCWTFQGSGDRRSSPVRGTWSFTHCSSSGFLWQFRNCVGPGLGIWATLVAFEPWVRVCLNETCILTSPVTDISTFAQQPRLSVQSRRDTSSSRTPSHAKVFV